MIAHMILGMHFRRDRILGYETEAATSSADGLGSIAGYLWIPSASSIFHQHVQPLIQAAQMLCSVAVSHTDSVTCDQVSCGQLFALTF